MKTKLQLAFVFGLIACALRAQTLDNSGNKLLNGAYRFRQVALLNYDQNGYVNQVRASYGVITFDGNGNYSVTGTFIDNTVSSGSPQVLSVNGTYVIGANGNGYVANPLAPTSTSDRIYGAVAQGVFTGSTTEEINTYLNDLFVAIPSGTPPTNSSFNGSYWAGVLDFTGASDLALKNAMFQLNPNGTGGFGSITVNGQNASSTASSITQTVSGGTYSFASDGSATLTLPLPSGVSQSSALFAGTKTMFVSADGNFILGWTASGYDIFVGVRAMTNASNSTFQGLFYTATLEDTSYCGPDSYSGSIWAARGDGNSIVHQRINQPLCQTYPYDYVSDNFTQLSANGTTANPDFSGYTYAFGAAGQAFVAVGTNGILSLALGVHVNSSSATGVYLIPYGIFNAASYAPVTAALAPGELITLFGSGLANATASAQGGQPFPQTLGGVQVTINGTAAPIYFVSPSQISVIVPYGVNLSAGIANVQVKNNGTPSNSVTMYLTNALPGVFTQNQAGYGAAAALRANGSVITTSNPANTGETISVYLTGLGTVTPPLPDGAVPPSSPLSNADLNSAGNLLVFFNDYNANAYKQANIQYAGLVPGLTGLYQLNVQVPSGVGPGNVYLELVATNSPGDTTQITTDVNQVQIAVGSGSSSAAVRPASRTEAAPHRPAAQNGQRRVTLPRGGAGLKLQRGIASSQQ